MISVVTVPYTGTIYTLQLLRLWGVETERKHLRNTDLPPYGMDRFGPGFPCGSSDEWAAYPDSRRVVCTLRDPILAVISAINRRIPDQNISVDGWAVMAEWWETIIGRLIHFFPIPPTWNGLTELSSFVGATGGPALPNMAPMNLSPGDPDGLKAAYLEEGVVPEHPAVQRAIEQLAETLAVENLFADHGFDLPWFVHSLEEREEANYNNSLNDLELGR